MRRARFFQSVLTSLCSRSEESQVLPKRSHISVLSQCGEPGSSKAFSHLCVLAVRRARFFQSVLTSLCSRSEESQVLPKRSHISVFSQRGEPGSSKAFSHICVFAARRARFFQSVLTSLCSRSEESQVLPKRSHISVFSQRGEPGSSKAFSHLCVLAVRTARFFESVLTSLCSRSAASQVLPKRSHISVLSQ